MSKLLWLLGATIGGAIGWWLGALAGTMHVTRRIDWYANGRDPHHEIDATSR